MKGGREGEMGRRVTLSSGAWTREEEEEKKGKQTDSRSKQQICGCQGGSREEERWTGSLELADANYYT